MIQTRAARRVRRRMMGWVETLYAQRSRLGYAEYRPMRSFLTPHGSLPPHDTDCSEISSMIAHGSGAPTPYVTYSKTSGYQGYTGTMLAELKHIPRWQTRRGDFVVYVHPDRPGGDHVAVLTQGGLWHRDPTVFSHGGPGAWAGTVSQELSWHPGCHTVYLRAVPLGLRG